MDLTVAGDYYQAQPAWKLRFEGNYMLLYVLGVAFNGFFVLDESIQRDDWHFNAEHPRSFSPPTRLSARGQFVSSKEFSASNQYGRTLYQRLNRFLHSSLSINHNAEWVSIAAALDRNQDLDADDEISAPRDQSLN